LYRYTKVFNNAVKQAVQRFQGQLESERDELAARCVKLAAEAEAASRAAAEAAEREAASKAARRASDNEAHAAVARATEAEELAGRTRALSESQRGKLVAAQRAGTGSSLAYNTPLPFLFASSQLF
jgi:hypothetical protein